jgi:hypothetical protein
MVRRIHKIIAEKGILPSDISNVDETGFRVGVGRRHKVISRDPSKKVYMADADNRSHVTVVECVQADGTQIPPMVILPGKRHLERNFPPGLPDDVLMAVSDTGYNNDELSMDWLRITISTQNSVNKASIDFFYLMDLDHTFLSTLFNIAGIIQLSQWYFHLT